MIPVVIRYSARNIWRGKGRNALVIILTAPMFLSLLLMLTTARALNIQAERLSRGTAGLRRRAGQPVPGSPVPPP